jgi:hypothetical protein
MACPYLPQSKIPLTYMAAKGLLLPLSLPYLLEFWKFYFWKN